MGKLIFIVLCIVFAWWVLSIYRKSLTRKEPPTAAAPEDMVRCAHCGVHLPKGESVQADGQFFCGTEHRDAYRK